ncbi:MAG: alpha-2-macroglobulin, partial [Pirellulales bacterium]|nr:alpha-2-macroglobulin [Pirellulales bacterium]
MKTLRLLPFTALSTVLFAGLALTPEGADGRSAMPSSEHALALKEFNNGNFKDAYERFRKLALMPDNKGPELLQDLNLGVQCLQRLNQIDQIDAFLEKVVKAHRTDWRLLEAAAQNYLRLPHYGYMISGQFQRGRHRGGGEVFNAEQRDRVRALQLLVQAMPLAWQDDNKAAVGKFFQNVANILLEYRGNHQAWRLQKLTDLATLPDYEPGWGGYYPQSVGTPVDAQGKPVYYTVPKRFEDAQNDGQRWRWCLAEAVEQFPACRNQMRLIWADFLQNQFGVQTMAQGGFGLRFGRDDDTRKDESGTYALHTLKENETIARLATGVKRFALPDEYNHIKVYRAVAEDPKVSSNDRVAAFWRLADVFANRRQYPKAADCLRQIKASSGVKERLSQIVDPWGRFEPVMAQPADGRGASVEFRFRNGKKVKFTANEVKVEKLLDDIKAYIKSQPGRLDWNKVNINDLGYRLIQEKQQQYVGKKVASWNVDLKPRPNHFDKRITVTTPLTKAGAYLLTAKMADGNVSFIVLWLDDTAIAKKTLDQKNLYYVADAVTGAPAAKANVEFFGYRIEHVRGNQYRVNVEQFAEHTDREGQVICDKKQQPQNHQWLILARTPNGGFGFLGFEHVWYSRASDGWYRTQKAFGITDRPVYRPKQKVHYKFWAREARYDLEDRSAFAGKAFRVEIRNPKGDKVVEKNMTADAYGGIEGELELPENAPLGQWMIQVGGKLGMGSREPSGHIGFRVEEYKKPEFEVSVDAPTEPIMLGEKITATVKAKYYFGSPVTEATVKYKVLRTSRTERWYPIGPWDWLYGRGYGWLWCDYAWYPGWWEWGCPCPHPIWWRGSHMPPEVVAEREVPIGPDGTVKIEIDTSVAKEIHPDQDHNYSITAEVVDQSRRTIVGRGNVLVARKPFKVYAWGNRGYYRVGDTIRASFSAQMLDNKPIEGKGELTLLKITYKNNEPVETPVRTWALPTDAQGKAAEKIKASQAGQYRLAYRVTDAKEHTIEGGYLFTVIGAGFDGSDFRFNNLELIPDKPEYKPGETVRLQVNTDRVGSTVLLFVRPSGSIYPVPKMLHLKGKSTVVEVGVVQKDMPNFFVEALTIADGRVHDATREIIVPPEKRILNVDIKPSSETYRPGEKAKVQIRLTDLDGKPFVGTTVVSIYDKSVEYISGGSNVPDIKAFFWKWRRSHYPRTTSNLGRGSVNWNWPNAPTMQDLGVFGATAADEGLATNDANFTMQRGQKKSRGGFGMGGMGGMADSAMAERAMPAPGGPRPMAKPMMARSAMREDKSEAFEMEMPDGGGEAAPMVEPTVRTKFADTAL